MSGGSQSELVEKDSYKGHITGIRPGAGSEIRGRIEQARDRVREIVAAKIRSVVDRELQPEARPRTGRAAATRRDDVGRLAGTAAAAPQRINDRNSVVSHELAPERKSQL